MKEKTIGETLRFDVLVYNANPRFSKANILRERTKDFDAVNADVKQIGQLSVYGQNLPIFLAENNGVYLDSLNNYIWDAKPTVYEVISLVCVSAQA